MALSIETVRQVVSIWNQLFPGVRGKAQLEILENTFCRSMQETFNDETFKIAAEMVLRETRYFPTVKDMFDLRNAVYQVKDNMLAKHGCAKMLPEETENMSAEEMIQNLERINIIKLQLSGAMSMEEAEVRQTSLTKWVLR